MASTFQGDPANIIVASDDELIQVALHGASVNRHAAAQVFLLYYHSSLFSQGGGRGGGVPMHLILKNRCLMATVLRVHIQAEEEDNDIVAIAFDARRALQFWIDGGSNAIFRASEPNGNQSHVGQKLDLDFMSLGVTPTNLAVDYLTG